MTKEKAEKNLEAAKKHKVVAQLREKMECSEKEIATAQRNGLDEKGITAMRDGNRFEFKKALDRLSISHRGNIWECTEGYKIWFNSASQNERDIDYRKNERRLNK